MYSDEKTYFKCFKTLIQKIYKYLVLNISFLTLHNKSLISIQYTLNLKSWFIFAHRRKKLTTQLSLNEWIYHAVDCSHPLRRSCSITMVPGNRHPSLTCQCVRHDKNLFVSNIMKIICYMDRVTILKSHYKYITIVILL